MKDDPQSNLIHHIEAAMSRSMGSMTGKELTVAFEENAKDRRPVEDPILWQQSFSLLEGPSFWISAGRDLWEALGRLTLEAAGIDEVTDDDSRSTWQEILNQTAAGIATALTADHASEVTVSNGSILDAEPPGLNWQTFTAGDGAGSTWFFKAAWNAELASPPEPEVEVVRSPAARDSAVSKTFDLLLEVALPVAVSFGRTSLQIREVLKLNTGSIVELDRFVTDPVEVIVNDCVIARGEVVVVDGNYGVRINQLASREDRLRTGMAETARRASRT